MNELKVTGNQTFMGKEIPVVSGGFGERKKCVSDKTIAEIHSQPEREIRKSIARNIKRFKENIDFIYLKKGGDEITTYDLLYEMRYSKQMIVQSESIYLLSERGYAKLIKIMDTDLAWEIHDKLMDEYFQMRDDRKPNQPRKSNLGSVNNAVKLIGGFMKGAGIEPDIQLLTVKAMYEDAGLKLPLLIAAEQQYYDTEYIAKEIGMYVEKSGKPAITAVSQLIKSIPIETNEMKDFFETKGNWQGTVHKYSRSVIEKVICWLKENGYPTVIEGKSMDYHVVYRK